MQTSYLFFFWTRFKSFNYIIIWLPIGRKPLYVQFLFSIFTFPLDQAHLSLLMLYLNCPSEPHMIVPFMSSGDVSRLHMFCHSHSQTSNRHQTIASKSQPIFRRQIRYHKMGRDIHPALSSWQLGLSYPRPFQSLMKLHWSIFLPAQTVRNKHPSSYCSSTFLEQPCIYIWRNASLYNCPLIPLFSPPHYVGA